MSEHAAFPVQGATRVIIDELARDGQVWGTADAAEIKVLYQADGDAPRLEVFREGDAIRLSRARVQRITLPAALAVTIKRAFGDLHLHSLTAEANVEAVHGDLRLTGLGGTTRVAQVDGDLRADDVADLRLIGRCAGDLRFETGGSLEAEMVAGDVRIAQAAAVRLNRVHGDLWAERLSGALDIEQVSGDVRLTEIGGPVNLKLARGDLRVRDLTNGLAAPQVQGDAVLQGAFAPTAAYTLHADGDVNLSLPGEADVRLIVRAHGRIRSDVQLTPNADGTPTFTATVGRGESRLQISSMGDIRIGQAGAGPTRAAADIPSLAGADDLRTLGERIRQQVTASLAAAGILTEGGWSRPSRPGRPARPIPPTPPTPPRPPTPPKRSSAEELRIFKMVEDGTINAAQAEMLLKALEA